MSTFDGILESIKAESCPYLDHLRVPVVEECAPAEECFDTLVDSLKNEPASTKCVFSCQMGRGRTTLGKCVVWL